MNARADPQASKRIFNDALDLAVEERETFITQACGGDEALLLNVRSLLKCAGENPSVLEAASDPFDGPYPERYQIQELLGRGAMGVVHRAHDTKLGRDVAIKRVAHFVRSPRLTREAKILASLDHPNIARLYDSHEEHRCLAMEYADGPTLADRLVDGPLSVEEALAIGSQITSALVAAHAKGVVHRDLKPANIKVTDEGVVKVLDFGIAKALTADTGALGVAERSREPRPGDTLEGTVVGTVGYMSPEQARGDIVDGAADIWALGCVLYECLMGCRAAQLKSDDGPGPVPIPKVDLSDFPAGIPASVRDLIASCVLPIPDERPTSNVVRETLESAQGQRAQPLFARGIRWRWIIGAGVAALTIVAYLAKGPPPWPAADELTIEQDGKQAIRAVRKDGSAAWLSLFSEKVTKNRPQHYQEPPATIVDEGRLVGVVACTHSDTAASGISILDARTGEVSHRKTLEWGVEPVNARGPLRGHWTSQWRGVTPPMILVALLDGDWYGFAIQLRDHRLGLRGTYYHPGRLYFGTIMPGSNSDSVLLFGSNSSARTVVPDLVPFNSELHVGCVLLLDREDFHGQAFPYSEGLTGRDWPGMERARERSYLLFPPIHSEVDGRVMKVNVTRRDNGHSLEAVLKDGRYFLLGEDLSPVSCYLKDHSIAESLSGSGEAIFSPVLLIRRGEREFIDVPVTNPSS